MDSDEGIRKPGQGLNERLYQRLNQDVGRAEFNAGPGRLKGGFPELRLIGYAVSVHMAHERES